MNSSLPMVAEYRWLVLLMLAEISTQWLVYDLGGGFCHRIPILLSQTYKAAS